MANSSSPKKQDRKPFRQSEEGQALVLTALALVVLMLMAGLGVDVGYLRYEKQQMQKAADAAAQGGALNLLYAGPGSATIVTAGRADSSANGFTDSANGVSVTINNPPSSGPFAGNNGYVEAIVTQPQPTFFMRVGGFNTVAVRARAVASARANAGGCIYVLDPSNPSTYTAEGGAQISANCGIYVNSTNNNAFNQNGTGCTDASFIAITGGIKSDSCSVPTNPSTNVYPPQADPLASVPAPAVGACMYQTSGQTAFTAGTWCGGITLNSGGPYTFAAGTYVLYGGGLNILSQANVSGTDVTFYNTGTQNGPTGFQPITITGGGTVTLSAPNSGTYAGILFFEDRNPQKNGQITNTINGQSGSTFTGALYFPSTQLKYAGGTAVGGFTVVIAYQVDFVGNSTFSNDYSSLTGGPLIDGVALVE